MRTEIQFRLADIELSRSPVDDRIAGIFRYEQPSLKGRGATVLVIADIHSSLYAYERFLDKINATVDQARLIVAGVGQDPIARFEKLIQRLNDAIANFLSEEPNPLNWKRVHVFVMELSEGHLCFTGTGSLMNAFFQKQSDGSYRSFDMLSSLEQPVEPDTTKLFSSIVCGDMNAGDVLIAGTNNLERLRGELGLKERLTTLPPVTAALDIQQDLERRGIPDQFHAIVISCHEVQIPEAESVDAPVPMDTDPSTASIEKLRSTEESTAHHTEPILSPERPFSRASLAMLLTRFKQMRRRLFARPRLPERIDAVALASLRSMNVGYGNVLTKKRKLLFAGGFLCVFLLITGGLWWRHASRIAAETAAWNSAFAAATDLRNRAESDLIYGNEARARNEIAQIEEALGTLASPLAERTELITKLQTELASFKDRLKKIVTVSGITELLSGTDRLVAPVLTADRAYVADPAQKEILSYETATKTVKHIPLPKNSGDIVAAAKGTNDILFATSNGNLLALNIKTEQLTSVPWEHAKTSSTADIVFYASKLYRLDPEQGQVWRSVQSGGGYGAERAYLKATNVPQTGSVSLAIDSSVYLLAPNGTVSRFFNGGQEGFSLGSVDPPLTSASAMWTEADQDKIIVVDPGGKRILIFDKLGNIGAQLIAPDIKSPSDLDVDLANKRMLLTDGNRLLLVPLP